ncbi:NAD-dependent epimerase/dehydratase family protein [Aliikangiella sp. IMCC44359]|uniref:NAD-dependent epimerase/dehydratase family protein n=1 Tax=Aliikangiella sp. IMCC44359 TaxID=3459125 RepID=UPI00403AFD97
MKAFVTGGSGIVGYHLINNLLKQGWEVYALARKNSANTYLTKFDVKLVYGDILDTEQFKADLPNDLDACFHLASLTGFWSKVNKQQWKVNVEGTKNIIQLVKEKNISRLIYTSSIAAWGIPTPNFNESHPGNVEAIGFNYGLSKKAAEDYIKTLVKEKQIDAVILNPANVFGSHDPNNWSKSIKMTMQGKLPGVPSGETTFCDADEVARAHISAFHKGRSGQNYILGGENHSFASFFQLAGKLLQVNVPQKIVPSVIYQILGYLSLWASYITNKRPDISPEIAQMLVANLTCSSEKAIKELDYKIIPLTKSMTECISWMRQEKMI